MADTSFLSKASGVYRSGVGGVSKPESYSTTFITPQGNYTFVSEDVVNKGLNVGDNNYWFPYFQNKENLAKFVNSSQQVDLADVKASGITSSDTWGSWVSNGLKQSPKGYLFPEGAIGFDGEVRTAPVSQMGTIKGLGQTATGELVYTTSGGHGNMYIAPNGDTHDPYTTYSSSFLGKVFGGLGEAIAKPIRDVSNFVSELGPIGTIALNIASPGLGTAVTVGNEAGRGNLEGAALSAVLGEITGNGLGSEIGVQGTPIFSSDPNAVGGVTGPDNIDVGGGFNPATGATAAELEAARLALDGTVSSPVYSPELPVGTELPPLPEPTIDEVINKIAPPPVVSAPPLEIAPPVEVGPELLGEAGGNTFPLEIEPVGSGPIPLGDAPTVNDITSAITGNADRAAMNSNAGYGEALTSAQIDAVNKAVASGWTVSEALNAARAGLFVNAIVGDPLGLGGGQPENAGGGSIGFEQVPIPAEWKSPTYAAPSAPIDLSSIFTDQNLLNGTQWRGLPAQQNVSFNDIFSSGQQQTPMGNMVDINQIVSAIIGQNTASQKPA